MGLDLFLGPERGRASARLWPFRMARETRSLCSSCFFGNPSLQLPQCEAIASVAVGQISRFGWLAAS